MPSTPSTSGIRGNFKIPDQKDQASDATDFELVTWRVIKKP